MKVTARATRAGDWWAVRVDEIDGLFTQARRLDQVAGMVRDAVVLFEDVDASTVDVEVIPVTAVDDLLTEVAEARRAAEVAQSLASTKLREAVALLRAERYTVRDAGAVLGISPQRVSQLADS